MNKILFPIIVLILSGCRNNNTPSPPTNQNSVYEHNLDSLYGFEYDTIIYGRKQHPDDTIPLSFRLIIKELKRINRDYEEKEKIIYSERYSNSLNLIFQNIDSLSNDSLPYIDKLFLDIYYNSLYNEIDTISTYLSNRQLVKLPNKKRKDALRVPKKDWSNFSGLVLNTKKGKVHSDDFESISFENDLQGTLLSYGQDRFLAGPYDKQRFSYDDLMIAALPNGGFESIEFIITIWREFDEHYELITILDNWLMVAIGGVWVEDIVPLDSNRTLIVGQRTGGDEGIRWGDFWLGVWSKPRDFKIIYHSGYYSEESDTSHYQDLQYKIDKEQLILDLHIETFRYLTENNHQTLIDSAVYNKRVSIDTLLNNDLTNKFNFGYQ